MKSEVLILALQLFLPSLSLGSHSSIVFPVFCCVPASVLLHESSLHTRRERAFSAGRIHEYSRGRPGPLNPHWETFTAAGMKLHVPGAWLPAAVVPDDESKQNGGKHPSRLLQSAGWPHALCLQ